MSRDIGGINGKGGIIRLDRKASLFARGALRRRTDVPWEVQVEITNRCNLDCGMCPRRAMDVPEEDMSEDVFNGVIRNLSGVRDLVLCGWGEPIIHRDFLGFVGRARSLAPDTRLRFTTNGHMLVADLSLEIIRLGVDGVSVSLDRTDAVTGAGHAGPEEVMKNVEEFLRARGYMPKPLLILQTTMHRGGLDSVLDVVGFARRVGADAVNLVRLDVSVSDGIERPDHQDEVTMVREARRAGGGKVPVLSVNRKWLPMRIATRGDSLCLRTLFHAYIDVHGNVTPCCMLRRMVMGNILEQSLDQIWNSDQFKRFFSDQERICAGCDALSSRYRDRG